MVTTILTSWTLAIYINHSQIDVQEKFTKHIMEPFPHDWYVTVIKRTGKTTVVSERSPMWPPGVRQHWGYSTKFKSPKEILPGWGRTKSHVDDTKISPSLLTYRIDSGSGWPMIAMYGTVDAELFPGGWLKQISRIDSAINIKHPYGPLTGETWTTLSFLPTAILYTGFVINTIFYTMVVCSVWLLIRTLRRWRRSRAGLCVICAYDLRGDLENGCPECGWRREAKADKV